MQQLLVFYKIAISKLFHITSKTSSTAGHRPTNYHITNNVTHPYASFHKHIRVMQIIILHCAVLHCIKYPVNFFPLSFNPAALHSGVEYYSEIHAAQAIRIPQKNDITLDANNNWKLHCKYFFHCIDRNQIVSSDGRVGGRGWGRKLQFLQFKMCVLVEFLFSNVEILNFIAICEWSCHWWSFCCAASMFDAIVAIFSDDYHFAYCYRIVSSEFMQLYLDTRPPKASIMSSWPGFASDTAPRAVSGSWTVKLWIGYYLMN